jgi:hypothetical protein
MKKLLVVGLLLIYSVTQLSVLAWYYSKNLIHALSADWQNIKLTVGRPDADLTNLRLDSAGYLATVKEGEISLNGTLYDVTKSSFCGSTVDLTLKKDEVETYLLNQYTQLTNWFKNHRPTRQSEQYVFNWMMKLYFSVPFSPASGSFILADSLRPMTGNRFLPLPYCSIPVKPPEQRLIFS